MQPRSLVTDDLIEFLQIVGTGKVADVKAFAAKHPDLNINYLDEKTSRSTLHLARSQGMYDALVELGCDANPSIRDMGGYNAFELMLNYYEYLEVFNFDFQMVQILYYQFWISEYNAKLPAHMRLVYVHNLEAINSFLVDNPTLTKLGFIVKKPNCLRAQAQFGVNVVRDFHLSAIYFERTKTGEVVVQFDSVLGGVYSLPALPGTNRVQYYSPLHRQADSGGCFEDAIVLLYKLLTQNNFNLIQFCQTNSFRDVALLQNLTKPERTEFKALHDKQMRGELEDTDADKLPPLRRRYEHEMLTRFYRHYGMGTIKLIHQLSALPPLLFLHVNFFRTIREIRLKEPKLFLKKLDPSNPSSPALIDQMLQKGRLRDARKTPQEVKKNLKNPDLLYDFKSRDFTDRENVFRERYLAYDRFAFNLFYGKLSAKEKTITNIKQEQEQEQSGKLARRSTSFLTGSHDSTDDLPRHLRRP